MARIDIPKPISTYRDLGTVELAKLARNQYIEGYGAADEFSNSVNNMQSLEKDQHIKTRLSGEYTGMLDGWSSRGDYETLGIAINKGANQFVQDYAPVQQSVKNRSDYAQRLKDAYEDKNINVDTYRGRLAQSDANYQGIQYGEDGSLQDNSVYRGENFHHDVDITEKINKRLKEIEPFIRENLGTDIPHNENMEVTNTTNARGEIKYWVNTKSKTVELPSSIIQDVVNDVMSEADVIASLAQEVEMKTYQLGDEGAMEHINKLLESGDLKEEDLVNEQGESLLETMGPLVALQNLMYQNSVSRETQLAIGAFGGVRKSSYGQTISYDEIYKINAKAKIDNAKKTSLINTDDVSYNTLVQIKPDAISYEDAINTKNQTVDLIKGNLSLVSGQLNQDPDKIEYDNEGREIFGSGGQGLNLEEMTNTEIIQNTETLVDGWRTASAQANTEKLNYIPWRNTINTLQPLEDGKGNVIEDQATYLTRLDDAYLAYENDILTIQRSGTTYLNNVAAHNELDISNFNSTMSILSDQSMKYNAINSKLNSPMGLSIPNSEGYGNDLNYSEYVKGRGDQLLISKFGDMESDMQISGQDIVDAYNWLASENPDAVKKHGMPSSISNPIELPEDFYGGNIMETFAFAGNQNENIHDLIYAISHIKQEQGFNVHPTQYDSLLGEWSWSYHQDDLNDRQYSFNTGVKSIIKQLQGDKSSVNANFASHFSATPISMEAAVMTNFGANYETTSIVNEQLKDFFKDNVIPSHWALRDAQGASPLQGWGDGYLNSETTNKSKNHFLGTVEYDIIEEQMGVLNMALGDDGAMIYIPIKVTKGMDAKGTDLKGKVYNYLVPAHYMNLPALNEYINSPEYEVNTQWNAGVQIRTDEWSPSQYSNVTFKYARKGIGKDEVIISGEIHSKQKGLAILVQELINKRGRRHQE